METHCHSQKSRPKNSYCTLLLYVHIKSSAVKKNPIKDNKKIKPFQIFIHFRASYGIEFWHSIPKESVIPYKKAKIQIMGHSDKQLISFWICALLSHWLCLERHLKDWYHLPKFHEYNRTAKVPWNKRHPLKTIDRGYSSG